MKVQFVNHTAKTDYSDLTEKGVYEVIGIEADHFRILNDEGRPYLYPPELFIIVDTQEPTVWEIEYGDEGEKYAYPPELNSPGFFEDYFDDDPNAVMTFHHYLVKQTALRHALTETQ
jgi:hypothetical protein